MNITVHRREVYGLVKYYPVCDKAKLFAHIAQTKTLTHDVLKRIGALGYEVSVIHTMDEAVQNS